MSSFINRRQFLKSGLQVGAGVILVRYINFSLANSDAPKTTAGMAFLPRENALSQLKSQRYEGTVKVTGGKIYGIDFRAKDMEGWPLIERRSIILRASTVGKIFTGLETQKITREFGVSHFVTGDDILAWGCKGGAPFLMPEFYVPSKTAPYYLGQPLALLTFKSTDEFLLVKDKIASLGSYCKYGVNASARQRSSYGVSRFVAYSNSGGDQETSFVKVAHDPEADQINSRFIQKIQQDLASSDWHISRGRYSTQCVDPMFMEPECGLSWYESSSQTLNLTLGTQSPYDDGVAIYDFFKGSKAPKIKKIIINCCFPGGGFGGRDSSDFPLHLAIAALSEPDVSHRIVHTRPDQFQGGIKRHPSTIDIQLAVDPQGKFQMLHSDIKLDGGGQNNYSFVVQSVAARNAGGAYRFQRSWVDATALPSMAIPSGSMRGYGTFQSAFALECLIDEVATSMKMDPIELRRKNVITGLGKIQTGVPLADEIHAIELLDVAKNCSLWKDRLINKLRKSNDKILYGTGFAFGAKTFGKGDDACLAGISLTQSGQLLLMTNGVDMGNGSATTLPLSLKSVLGRPADVVQIGVTSEFSPLRIYDSMVNSEIEQERMALDPCWVPLVSMSTAASTSAYELRHSVLEAGKILLRFGLWPAAASILKLNAHQAKFDPKAFSLDETSLRYQDGRSISFADLTSKAYDLGLVTGVMVHAFYRTRWASATFPIGGASYTTAIDAVALRMGSGGFESIPRSAVDFPSWSLISLNANRMSCYASIVAIELTKATGDIKVVDAQSFLECGPPIERQIVEGQMEGAFAMGIGQALKEDFPASISDGPGAGGWNLHRYQVALARDCALGRAQFHILSADQHDEPKGMSEVVLNPIPAAIANALADATGKRFYSLPLTPELIKATLS